MFHQTRGPAFEYPELKQKAGRVGTHLYPSDGKMGGRDRWTLGSLQLSWVQKNSRPVSLSQIKNNLHTPAPTCGHMEKSDPITNTRRHKTDCSRPASEAASRVGAHGGRHFHFPHKGKLDPLVIKYQLDIKKRPVPNHITVQQGNTGNLALLIDESLWD